jgi:RNA polymerase sigma-70 factor (ECF subfamily)
MDLAAILRQRDRQSFDWLYSQYAPLVFGMILKMVKENAAAENLLLETFVAVWRDLDEFDAKNGTLPAWILRIARTRANEYIRNNDQEAQQRLHNMEELWISSRQRQYSNQ